MFSIVIHLVKHQKTGLNALDWRRERGFDDGTCVYCDDKKTTFRVSEDFARRHFDPSEVSPVIDVDLDDLRKGEVVRAYKDRFELSLSQEAAERIFIASRKVEYDKDFGHIIKDAPPWEQNKYVWEGK
jgi:hypothetical protein